MANLKLKSKILEIVDNQIQINDPKITKETMERLMDMGYSDIESKEMIGRVLVEEMYDILKNQVPFNEKRYSDKLNMLP
ncbi:hypothetical protein DZB84_23015 [Bacillus sp. HNG]|uniref:hypothetical protein n=1 Tax=Fredinandcohnia sp. QZ13 TaxID=3073144 RepID=UPI000E2E8395|nr:hypothetical protein [Fredinandcohnia sp. QZ13]MDR4888155.1 hypothetical protein [Fredinandcohnia sp. QZ13]RFB10241.1 hypothetical protein DZB84_23015 [Bacillus sp. HNG]